MQRVFVAERTNKFVITAAESYGALIYLSDIQLNPFSPNDAARTMLKRLRELQFDPHRDFLLMTGNSLVLALLLAVASQEFEQVNLLLFDNRKSLYNQRVFSAVECVK